MYFVKLCYNVRLLNISVFWSVIVTADSFWFKERDLSATTHKCFAANLFSQIHLVRLPSATFPSLSTFFPSTVSSAVLNCQNQQTEKLKIVILNYCAKSMVETIRFLK